MNPASSPGRVTTARSSHLAEDYVEHAGSSPPQQARQEPVRRSTAQFKVVPETLEQREFLKREAARYAETMDKSRPFTRLELEQHGRRLLQELGLPEKYLGFTMVMIGNAFWKRQFLAIPFHKRMLLLPHCLKHAEGCPAEYDEFGLDCERCGACSIADYKTRAEQLGYKVLVAEGSPVVLKIIVSGHVDGILGVACLNVLEKAIDKVLLAGVPSYAVPLHSGDCKNTTLDAAWVWELLDQYQPLEEPQTASYIPLMRYAHDLFEQRLESLLPSSRQPLSPEQPLTCTEALARDWLRHGGKRLRPFVTLAAYDALMGSQAVGSREPFDFPLAVQRIALSMEAFHKASLVHDDIEDDDPYRYGRETLHRQYGIPEAINVGDHLIGLGYRLISMNARDLDPGTVSDILDRLAQAHQKLCEGQGAELRWQSTRQPCSPLDAMKIYALKTAPAFEAALYAGIRLAGPAEAYDQALSQFCRHVGVGFQILNDLKDWHEHDGNKCVSGRDAEMAKPTLLLALAFEAASAEQRSQLMQWLSPDLPADHRTWQLRQLYQALGVFRQAELLVEKCKARAEAIADEIQPDPLRQLFYYLVDTILTPEHQAEPPPAVISLTLPAGVS